MKDTKGTRLQEEEEDFEPQVELHFTILEESEGGISQGKLWHCDINAELQPDCSSLPEPDDESIYSDRTRSPSPEVQTLPSELQTLPSELHRLPSELQKLPSELQKLPSELQRLPSELQRLPSELQRLPSELQRLPSELQRLPSELQRLPSELQRLPSELQRLPSEPQRLPSDLQKFPPGPERGARDRRKESYLQPSPKHQVELHFTILEESEGGISEGKLCASEISSDEQLEIDYPKGQWDGPAQFGQLMLVAKNFPPTQHTLEEETKVEVSQQGRANQQVDFPFTVLEDSEEVSFSQGPEDYPMWESPFKPDMYQGDYPKDDWDLSLDSMGEAFESSFPQQFCSGGRLYPCTECGRNFNRKSTLTRHWRTHTGEKPYSCLDCGRCFSLNLNLLTHQMTHTGEKPYKCPDCGQSFTRSTSVTRHQRSHREGSPYKSDSWEESFPYNYPVPFPYPMPPVEEKSYVCPDCGEAFMQSGSFNKHLRMHRGDRPYKCVVCGEGFCSMSKLYRHERIHLVEKPYHCEICGKSFAVKSTLTRHQMLHQAERPYMCSHCEKGYVQRSHLARHHQKAHPELPFNPVKANVVPATILDSDNLVTYFWGDEEMDAGLEPVPTQLIYSGAD